MGDFFMCVAQYVIIMIVLAAIGFCGALIGVKLRKMKDAKTKEQEIQVMKKSYGVNELRRMYLEFFESKGHLAMSPFSLPLLPSAV